MSASEEEIPLTLDIEEELPFIPEKSSLITDLNQMSAIIEDEVIVDETEEPSETVPMIRGSRRLSTQRRLQDGV